MQLLKSRDSLTSSLEGVAEIRASLTGSGLEGVAESSRASLTGSGIPGHSRARSVGSGARRRLSIETGGEDGAVRAWNSTGQLIQRLDVKSKDTVHKRSAVLTIATHPHKNMVVSGSHDGRVRIFSEKK